MKSMKSCVLTINGGSSSIKFALFEIGEPLVLLFDGEMERIGTKNAMLTFNNEVTKQKSGFAIHAKSHDEASIFLINWLERENSLVFVKVIGHRRVHGMEHTEPEQITDELLDELRNI